MTFAKPFFFFCCKVYDMTRGKSQNIILYFAVGLYVHNVHLFRRKQEQLELSLGMLWTSWVTLHTLSSFDARKVFYSMRQTVDY